VARALARWRLRGGGEQVGELYQVLEEVERASIGQCGRPGPGFAAASSTSVGGRLGPGRQGGRLQDKTRWRRHKCASRRSASTYVGVARRAATDGPADTWVQSITVRSGRTSMRLGASAAWEGVEPRDGTILGWRDLGRRPGGSDAEGERGLARACALAGATSRRRSVPS
jgi:hypothetical protein